MTLIKHEVNRCSCKTLVPAALLPIQGTRSLQNATAHGKEQQIPRVWQLPHACQALSLICAPPRHSVCRTATKRTRQPAFGPMGEQKVRKESSCIKQSSGTPCPTATPAQMNVRRLNKLQAQTPHRANQAAVGTLSLGAKSTGKNLHGHSAGF